MKKTEGHLPATGPLSALSQAERDLISSFGELLVFTKDHDIIIEGREQDHLYYLIDGLLHATVRMPRAKECTLLGRIEAGEWFGEVNIFNPAAASATVTAKTRAQVWRISRGGLEQLLNQQTSLGAHLLMGLAEQLAQRLRAADERLQNILAQAMSFTTR